MAALAVTAAITYQVTRSRQRALASAAVATAMAAARAAHRDGLTGLGNRTAFHTALSARPAAVILINLDDTRAFVRRFGDRAFDQMLVLTAGRLGHLASLADGAAFRLRRDEFAVTLPDGAGAADHAARLAAAVAEPTELVLSGPPITVTVTACAGVAFLAPSTADDPRRALVHADRAMRAAKRAGHGRTAVFDPTMCGWDDSRASHPQRRQDR